MLPLREASRARPPAACPAGALCGVRDAAEHAARRHRSEAYDGTRGLGGEVRAAAGKSPGAAGRRWEERAWKVALYFLYVTR